MYNYLSAKNPNIIEAVLHTEGRVVVAGDSSTSRSDVVIRYLCFLVDFMHVAKEEILFVNLYREKTEWIKDNLGKYLPGHSFDKVIFTIGGDASEYISQNNQYKYLIVWGIERITHPLNLFVDNLISRSKNAYLCGDIAYADNFAFWEALEYFVNPKNDVVLFLTDYSSIAFHRAKHKIKNRKRIEQEQKEKERQERNEKCHVIGQLISVLLDYRIREEREILEIQEREMMQKRELFSNIIPSLEKYVFTYNRYGGQQFWLIRLLECDCRQVMLGNDFPLKNSYMLNVKSNGGNDARRLFYEYMGKSDYEASLQFKSWWSINTLIQDNDILLLQDTTSDLICGIGRIFISKNNKKDVFWINKDRHELNIVVDKSQYNPTRIEDKKSIAQIKRTIERINRGF